MACPLRDGCCDKKDVAGHVTRSMYAGSIGFLRIWDFHDAPFRVPLAAKTLGKIRRLTAAGREE